MALKDGDPAAAETRSSVPHGIAFGIGVVAKHEAGNPRLNNNTVTHFIRTLLLPRYSDKIADA
jgi:hypothetical protein